MMVVFTGVVLQSSQSPPYLQAPSQFVFLCIRKEKIRNLVMFLCLKISASQSLKFEKKTYILLFQNDDIFKFHTPISLYGDTAGSNVVLRHGFISTYYATVLHTSRYSQTRMCSFGRGSSRMHAFDVHQMRFLRRKNAKFSNYARGEIAAAAAETA